MQLQTVSGPNGETRIPPGLPASQMTSFELHQPLETHYRFVSCTEAECAKRANGWQMGFDLTDERKVQAANALAVIAKRRNMIFSHQTLGSVVTFTFQPGQDCFEPHRVALERDPIAIVRNGDWRGNPRGETRQHSNLENWVDDMQNNLDQVRTIAERG